MNSLNSTLDNNKNNNENNNKHLLFYSNLCTHSKDIYQKIIKYNIKQKFYLINISDNKFQIPLNIKTVPTLLLNDKSTILKDTELNTFLDKLYKELNPSVDGFNNISGISNVYSFLDNDEQNDNMTLNFGLTDKNSRIETLGESDDVFKNNMTNSLDNKMNSLQQDRDLEISDIFKNKKTPEN
jgi:hypothetical protein|tara:strand:- start:155 stop:703 length:549 start_codon:yes stop_codon:yes gene_type:complete